MRTLQALVTIIVGTTLFLSTSEAEATFDVDTHTSYTLDVPHCDGDRECEEVFDKIKARGLRMARKDAPQACTDSASMYNRASSKVLYVIFHPDMNGPGNYNPSTREYKLFYKIRCRLYRS